MVLWFWYLSKNQTQQYSNSEIYNKLKPVILWKSKYPQNTGNDSGPYKTAGSNLKLLFTGSRTSHLDMCSSTTEHAHSSYAHMVVLQMSLTNYVKFKLKILCPKLTPKFTSILFSNVQSPKQKKARKMQL
jgi:hypothetical protein